jgi:citrate synthase
MADAAPGASRRSTSERSTSDETWLDAASAAELLGVKRRTLYAYASRGLVRTAPEGSTRRRRYLRADLDRLRARSDARAGHAAVAAGALRWGEPVLDSALTEIRPEGHQYRQYPACELAEAGMGFERVAELLWHGQLPEQGLQWPTPKTAGVSARTLSSLLAAGAGPLDVLAVALPVLAVQDDHRHDVGEAAATMRARTLLRRMTAVLAIARDPKQAKHALQAHTVARSLLRVFGGRTGQAAATAVDRALVLCADHELNPSSFAARVAASAGADLYASVGAALATFSGPSHGGATERVERLLHETGRPDRAVRVIRERLACGESLPGFGHPLYPQGDPRGALLMREARNLGGRIRAVQTMDALAQAMELAGGDRPTVDFGLVALRRALKWPAGSAAALFAIGRSAGWIAHAREQQAMGFMLRPRARPVRR